MITALAFVPPVNVVESFEMLSEELERVEPTLQPILDWLEMYYIGILRREGVRRVPAFPIDTWNLYNRVLTEQMVRHKKFLKIILCFYTTVINYRSNYLKIIH